MNRGANGAQLRSFLNNADRAGRQASRERTV